MVRHQVQWRLRGGVLCARLLPVLPCAAVAIWAAPRATDLTYAALALETATLGALLLIWQLRTRVRLVDAGVEVRELRTRVYAWDDIAEVAPGLGHRGIQLRFADGSRRILPAPRRLGVAATDPEIEAAAQLIRAAAER